METTAGGVIIDRVTWHPWRAQRESRIATHRELDEWRKAELAPISPELLALARSAAERELTSRRGLNGRLAGTVAFAGAVRYWPQH
jgi:hypothetical protein